MIELNIIYIYLGHVVLVNMCDNADVTRLNKILRKSFSQTALPQPD